VDGFRVDAAWARSRMADRICIAIPAGEKRTHRFEISAEGDPFSSIDWSAFVHDEMTIDLEVSARFGTEESTVLLQEVSRGRTFRGSVDPEDKRFPTGSEVTSINFDFGNEYSWWNGKDIELIVVLHSDVKRSGVPSLPPLQADARPSRSIHNDAAIPEVHTGMPKLASSTAAPDTAAQAKLRLLTRLDASLESWLGEADESRPAGFEGTWLEHITPGVVELRSLCQQSSSEELEKPVSEDGEKPATDDNADAVDGEENLEPS